LAIAERFDGEIVNFDSLQVYRGFNIGTAKVAAENRRGIPHHLIDIVDPVEVFTAGDYAKRARGRGRLPVMAGGTGFYLRAALEGLFRGPLRDEALRERLAARAASKPPGYLHRLLGRLDAVSAGRIHPNDISKLIRAIEVCVLGNAPMSRQWRRGREAIEGYRVLRIGLDPPRETLRQRIRHRTEIMFAAGLAGEVQTLLRDGVPRDARPFASLGYRQVLRYLAGGISLEQAKEDTSTQTRQYSKRQMTWFRREPEVRWFGGLGDDAGVQAEVLEWLATRIRA
jgi:tRNA dimethylallyltransferase